MSETIDAEPATVVMPEWARVGIVTKYLGPTDTRGGRVKARLSDHGPGDPTLTVGYDYALDIYANHAEAARQFAIKFRWDGEYSAAATSDGYVFARVI
jgi:hypothetical protein